MVEPTESLSERSRLLGLLAICLVLVLIQGSFGLCTQDDAFISFRYAQNLVEGHGLVYNIGERVEGYTNFLWTILFAPFIGAGLDPAVKAMMEQFMGPNSPGGRALSLNGAFSVDGAFNRRDVHAAEIPAANGITNARTLARIYAATIGDVDGVRLLKPETVERARTKVTPENEPDACLIMPTTFGMGFMVHGMFSLFGGPGSFGHPGAGGSVAFALPESELSVAYVMNKMATNLANDVRAQTLANSAVECAGAASR